MSEEINRYTIVDSGNPSKVWNSTNGSWVTYKDHYVLLQSERLKNEQLTTANEILNRQITNHIKALSAERLKNEKLRKVLEKMKSHEAHFCKDAEDWNQAYNEVRDMAFKALKETEVK